jgi:hypothetical protein
MAVFRDLWFWGSTLYVTPLDLNVPILDRPSRLSDSPAVILSYAVGETSGRFTVAKIAAQVFPRARWFVDRVRNEGADDPNEYVFAPPPGDSIHRLSDFAVSYLTRSGAKGLGTSLMSPSATLPISGLILPALEILILVILGEF